MDTMTAVRIGTLALALSLLACGDDSGSGIDSSAGDTSVGDTSAGDSSVGDTSPRDTSTGDTGSADTGVMDASGDAASDASADASGDAASDATSDAAPDASSTTVSIEFVESIAGTPIANVAVELLDLSDFGVVLGTGTTDATGVATITLTTLPADRYVAHGALTGYHDTYFYAPDTHTDAPSVTGVPLVTNGVWTATYTGATLTETAGTGWILVRGRTAAGASVTDMTLGTSAGGDVRYLSSGLLHDGTSSPDGEALILNAEAAAAVLTVTAGGAPAMSPVEGIADAAVATIITLP